MNNVAALKRVLESCLSQFLCLIFYPQKAEIKRLQEANKAARKERQLILKQQVEIERIRQTTMKLQEKLKSAGENKLVSVQFRSWSAAGI